MKFCTLRTDHPDGSLARVSDGLNEIWPAGPATLQDYLDGGNLDQAETYGTFDPAKVMAPLPRAYQFLDGSAYVNHVALVRQARGAEMPERFWTDPLMYQGCSTFLGPQDDIAGNPEWGIDFEAEVAVITREVPLGTSPEEAVQFISIVMLMNDISLRNLIPD